MRVLVIGLGVQGRKRLTVAGADIVGTVDPVVPEARYRHLEEVPLTSYDAALVCTPDQTKVELLRHLLARGKHALVEKPLTASDADQLRELERLARASGAVCYTAYNHRFEPHLVRLKALLDAGTLGSVYLGRFFYGNGTARDVRESLWRDQGGGVLTDLGSHLLDLVHFLFGDVVAVDGFRAWSFSRFENRAWDHALFGMSGPPTLVMEATLVAWRNTFTAEVFGERGSAHVHGLCKWGPSMFTVRRRVLPSGRPEEQTQAFAAPDPTWAAEYEHFKRLCQTGRTDLTSDLWINAMLNELARSPGAMTVA
jgi:predicted dehydrogenase